MKYLKGILLTISLIFILLFSILVLNTNIVVVGLYRDAFAGGTISLSNGSLINVEKGSSFSVGFLRIKSATDIVLKCESENGYVMDKKGYLEPGPVQYLALQLRDCKIIKLDNSKNIFDVILEYI